MASAFSLLTPHFSFLTSYELVADGNLHEDGAVVGFCERAIVSETIFGLYLKVLAEAVIQADLIVGLSGH